MTNLQPPRALVSGGSIAGLSAAYWLTRTGWRVTLLERSAHFRDGGQNVDVRGVGHEVLDRMGLVDTVKSLNTGETGTVVVDERDAVVATMPDVGPDSSTAELEVLRGDLARAILDVLPDDVAIRFDDTITEVVDDDDQVRVTTTGHPEEEFDLLVIAEGVRSSTRALLFTDVVEKPLGIDMVFGTIERTASDDQLWRWMTTTKGRQAHLRPDNHGTTRAILAFSPSQGLADEKPPVVQRQLQERFADVGWSVPRILDGFAGSDDVYADSLTQIHASTWHAGRTVMIGDAAWCVTPLGGGGASLALTGGYVLAAYLSQAAADRGVDGHLDRAAIDTALERAERWLRPLVDEVQKMPPGMVKLAYPQTPLGLAGSRLLNKALTSRVMRPVAARMTEIADTDQELPSL